MRMKTGDLTDAALDWAVLVAQFGKHEADNPKHIEHFNTLRAGHPLHQQAFYSSNWAHGGPIVEREKICISFRDGDWLAEPHDMDSICQRFHGPTSLIAAMRCFVASKLGDNVDVPSELLSPVAAPACPDAPARRPRI
jgi:hypothetical protein